MIHIYYSLWVNEGNWRSCVNWNRQLRNRYHIFFSHVHNLVLKEKHLSTISLSFIISFCPSSIIYLLTFISWKYKEKQRDIKKWVWGKFMIYMDRCTITNLIFYMLMFLKLNPPYNWEYLWCKCCIMITVLILQQYNFIQPFLIVVDANEWS